MLTVREARLAWHLRQRELASMTGICIRDIRRLERGEIDIRRCEAWRVLALARALHVSPYALVDGTRPRYQRRRRAPRTRAFENYSFPIIWHES